MNRKNGREPGEVFTDLSLVHYLLDEVDYRPSTNLRQVKILEPSSGIGIFAVEIIRRLAMSSTKFGFDFIKAVNKNIRFVELKKESFEHLKETIKTTVNNLGYDSGKISNAIFANSNFLKIDFCSNFDCIVGNPPYIRHEIIDSDAKMFYKKKFTTFKFRADIYILFYEKSLNLLSKTGKLSFVCSNRWLYNQYGQLLRKKIAEGFHLHKLVNIEKTTPFDEKVIAYPCISTIFKKKNGYTYYYQTDSKEIDFRKIILGKIRPPKDDSWSNLFLDYNINHKGLSSILEQGFNIGIGVATGADKIFIKKGSEINGIEKSRLMPIIKSKALSGDKINWDNSYIVNPFEEEGLCDLDNYPNMSAYFHANKKILMQRYIAKKNPEHWYKTIDKIKLELKTTPKLLLPDLSYSKFLFIDSGNFYPHHNVYYITHDKIEHLKVLACLLMSDFIKKQLSQIGIRMNGGLPRFQSQTLKKIRIPIFTSLEKSIRCELVKSYDNKNLRLINKIVNNYCIQNGIQNR